MAASRIYGVVWRWHFIAGLLACPVVLVIALTGALYVFQPELDPMLDPELLVVEPAETHAPIDPMFTAANERGCRAFGFLVPDRDDGPIRLYCTGSQRQLFFDPYRGELLGERDERGGFFGVVFGLHWDLLLGSPGRFVVEWATSCTLVLLLSGAVLWWPRGKRTRGGVWWPRRDVGPRQLLRDMHAVAGIYVLPVLALLTATGLMWTMLAGHERWHPLTEDAVHETWEHPPSSTIVAGESTIGIDRALAAAGIDRAGEPLAIYGQPPATPAGSYVFLPYSIEEAWRSYSVWIDAYSGKELSRLDWDDRSVAGKLDSVAYSVHVGTILGLPGRIAAMLAALVLAALCVTGPWMWWKRRPAGRLAIPPRGESRLGLVVVLLAVVGWLLPTIGVMLLAILVVETFAWLRRRR